VPNGRKSKKHEEGSEELVHSKGHVIIMDQYIAFRSFVKMVFSCDVTHPRGEQNYLCEAIRFACSNSPNIALLKLLPAWQIIARKSIGVSKLTDVSFHAGRWNLSPAACKRAGVQNVW